MGLKFNFNISLKPKRQTRSPSTNSYTIIETKVEGLIKILEDMLNVNLYMDGYTWGG